MWYFRLNLGVHLGGVVRPDLLLVRNLTLYTLKPNQLSIELIPSFFLLYLKDIKEL